MSGEKGILLFIGGVTLVVAVIIIVFSVRESKQSTSSLGVSSYTQESREKPQAVVGNAFTDLGRMTVNDEKTATFTVKNLGEKPLALFGVRSSCDCTFGQVKIGSLVSPEFSMHAKGGWVGEVLPGKEATVLVIYRPAIMPVKGIVTRDVFVATNDPKNPKLTFSVKAYVE